MRDDGNEQVEVDSENLSVNVVDQAMGHTFYIAGFSSKADITTFLNVGDFNNLGKDNEYLTITGSNDKLVWTEI